MAEGIQVALNKAIQLNPELGRELQTLGDCSLEVLLLEFGRPLLLSINNAQISVAIGDEVRLERPLNEQQLAISLSVLVIGELQNTNNLTKLIKQDKLDFEGNLQIAQGLIKLVKNFNFDLEAQLAKLIGDIPAYQLTQFGKQAFSFFQQQSRLLSANLADVLLDEKPVAVRAIMLENFVQEVGELRDHSERLAARLANLEKKYAQ